MYRERRISPSGGQAVSVPEAPRELSRPTVLYKKGIKIKPLWQ